jgi:YegS/Rv2252/BmrU family lipid kinase
MNHLMIDTATLEAELPVHVDIFVFGPADLLLTMRKNIALVCNPTSDNAKALRVAFELTQILGMKDIDHTLFESDWPTAWDFFSEAWIIGGDGTLNHFINRYLDFDLPLSIFKGGSGNDFHSMLYPHLTTLQQAEQVLQGKTVAVDAGLCNGKLFLNGVGVGFDGAIVKDLLGKKKMAGKASYLLSILKQIAFYHEQSYTIHSDTQQISGDCLMVSIANGRRYGGAFHVAPKASLNDSLLDLNIVGKIPALKRIKYLPIIEKGEHLQLPFVRYEQTAKVLISAPNTVHAHLDGEPMEGSVFEITCLPGKFRFLV